MDVGDRTVGLALSDPSGTLASGITTLRRTRLRRDLAAIFELVDTHSVQRLIVGWPLMMSGKVGAQARKTGLFIDAISAERPTLEIIKWDERLSTKAATRVLIEGNASRARRKQVVDKVAATLILQGWLDAQGRG